MLIGFRHFDEDALRLMLLFEKQAVHIFRQFAGNQHRVVKLRLHFCKPSQQKNNVCMLVLEVREHVLLCVAKNGIQLPNMMDINRHQAVVAHAQLRNVARCSDTHTHGQR